MRMPAEWEPHQQTWMGWPDRPDNWRDDAAPAQHAFAAVATAIAQFEPVTVCANPEQWATARCMLPPSVNVIALPHNDSWFRDIAPTFALADAADATQTAIDGHATPGGLVGIDWIFDAWGGLTGDGLYGDWRLDGRVAPSICKHLQCPVWPQDIILEGGAIHVDGQGTLLTTEECLLRRNPTITKSQFEDIFSQTLGITKVLWLKYGLHADDDTNGHVDNIAAFAAPGVVLLSWTDDQHDPQLLESSTDAKGRPVRVVKLPLPQPLFYTEEEATGVQTVPGTIPREPNTRMAASYVNFYIANGGVVMPLFGVPEDVAAQRVLAEVFPDRQVVGVQTREVLLGGGNIHCITQQQPRAGYPAPGL